MTHGRAVTAEHDAELGMLTRCLDWDLSRISGQLSEIATCWRRHHDSLPDLPLALPMELGDRARQAGADVLTLASASPAERPGLALSAVRRIAGLRDACTSAILLTQVLGTSAAGDGELWESVTGTLHRAGVQSLSILLQVSTVTNWSVDDGTEDESASWFRLQFG